MNYISKFTGEQIETRLEMVSEIKNSLSEVEANAEEALTLAQTAQSDASAAKTSASEAKDSATTALNKATTADDNATDALNKATEAQAMATQAQTLAQEAKDDVSEVKDVVLGSTVVRTYEVTKGGWNANIGWQIPAGTYYIYGNWQEISDYFNLYVYDAATGTRINECTTNYFIDTTYQSGRFRKKHVFENGAKVDALSFGEHEVTAGTLILNFVDVNSMQGRLIKIERGLDF